MCVSLRRRLAVRPGLVLLAVASCAGWAAASDNLAIPRAAASSASAPSVSDPVIDRSRAGGKTLVLPSRLPAGTGPRDPMEVLREHLALKLGATRPPGSHDNDMLRVATKAPPGSAAAMPPVDEAARRPPRPKADSIGDAARKTTHGRSATGDHWAYAGSTGPESWSEISPEFTLCSRGNRQSPIDIRDGIKVELDPVQFHYQPSAFRVVDNGHTVQVNLTAGNSIEVMGRRYELVQFHFHRPSEERVEGKRFDMVVHLVHRAADGRLAVVAVLLEQGGAQQAVQSIWNNLPLEKGEELAAAKAMNPDDLLPTERGYLTYMGSLTTPPCTEGVLWMVMKQPVSVSAEQIAVFARLYPMNARPLQSDGGRLIKESN